MSCPVSPSVDLAAFQRQRLQETLEYCLRRVPYYKRVLSGRSSTSLEAFPVLTREVIAQHLEEFLVLDRFPDYLITTGGSSGGPLNVTFRTEDEYWSAHSLLTGAKRGEVPDPASLREFALDVFFNSNGYYWRKAVGWPTVSLVLEQRAHAELIHRLLMRGLPVRDRRIPARHLSCQNGPLRALTGYFWVRGYDHDDSTLRSLLGYGGHISQVWRARLRELWGCDVQTVYGLSEFALGNAVQCTHCRCHHYLTAWPEFLSLDSDEPVRSGNARLVLTSLVPFTSVQPRVRYVTGDLVTMKGICGGTNLPGFTFRGRHDSSLSTRLSDGSWHTLLSEIDILELIDQLPHINSRRHPAELQIWEAADLPLPPFRMGFPRYRITIERKPSGGAIFRLALEADFDPTLEPQRAGRLMELFSDVQSLTLPALAADLIQSRAEIQLTLHPPASLPLRSKGSA